MRMEKHDQISVIVPVYNTAKYLPQCIESILDQTYTNFELLLIDDGSSDNSGEICESYAERDTRVRVIHQENAGVSAARNRGLDEACGEYIMFVDSDDYVDSELLECAYHEIRAYDVDIYICGLVVEISNGGEIISKEIYTAKGKKTYDVRGLLEDMDLFYPGLCICGPCHKLFKRKVIENENIRFDTRLSFAEDFLFNQEYLARIRTVQIDDEVYYHYRKEREESLNSRWDLRHYDMAVYVYDQMRDLLEKVHCTEERKQRYEHEYCNTLIAVVLTGYRKQLKKTTAQERRHILCQLSDNPYIKKLPFGEIKSNNLKVVLLCLKLQWVRLLDRLFIIRYQTGVFGLGRKDWKSVS